jgi:hypothetical protein
MSNSPLRFTRSVFAGPLVAFVALAWCAGCGDDAKQPAVDLGVDLSLDVGSPDLGAPTASLKSPAAYSVVKGTAKVQATVNAAVAKLELLVDGKVVSTLTKSPWTFSWNTTTSKDGLAKLSLKATGAKGGTATSAQTTVVVLNEGEEASFEDGSSGTITVPSSGYIEEHLKYHWTMPSSIHQILAVITWDQKSFELELKLGVGECPDNGTTYATEDVAASPGVAVFPDQPQTSSFGNATWFAHVAPTNASSNLGKSTSFSIKAYLLH